MSLVAEILGRMPDPPIHTFVCVTASPFTVYLDGDTTTAVPGLKISGQTITAADRGYAIWCPPLPPICFEVT